MPAGSEWIIIIFFGSFFLISPVLAIIYYTRNKQLRLELERMTREKDDLLKRLLDKTA